MEGIGGPVNVERYSTSGIDPALEDCCRREVRYGTVCICECEILLVFQFQIKVLQ